MTDYQPLDWKDDPAAHVLATPQQADASDEMYDEYDLWVTALEAHGGEKPPFGYELSKKGNPHVLHAEEPQFATVDEALAHAKAWMQSHDA